MCVERLTAIASEAEVPFTTTEYTPPAAESTIDQSAPSDEITRMQIESRGCSSAPWLLPALAAFVLSRRRSHPNP